MKFEALTSAVYVVGAALVTAVAGLANPATQETAQSGASEIQLGAAGAGSDTGRVSNATRQTGPVRVKSTAADRERVTITVYNQNFGLVREIRRIPIGTGEIELEFGDVASSIQTETVNVRSLNAPFSVLEQNYVYDLLSPQKLLEKYVGRTVTIYRFNQETEREEAIQAEVLAVNNGTILRIGDEITFNYPGRIAFPEVPDNLIAEPTLLWLTRSEADEQLVEVTYLTGALNWKADYVMLLNERDTRANMTGWVTLTNNAGATYDNAELKLVAGDVQRVGRNEMMQFAARAAVAEAQDAVFSEQAFFEYHLYTLGRPATVKNAEQKQVTLLEAPDFAIDKKFIFYGAAQYYRGQYGIVTSNQKIGVYVDFDNERDNGLGMALPAGIVRVYKEDDTGARQFVGEDRIDHTPRDERVRIKMGEAFDVVGDRRQMNYDVISGCVGESEWEVEVRNHKDDDIRVDVIEPIGGDWTILRSTHEAQKLDAHTFMFDVPVPARGSTKINYLVRVRWC